MSPAHSDISPLDDPMGYARESARLEAEAPAEFRRHDPLTQNAIENVQHHLDEFSSLTVTEPYARYWLQEATWQQSQLNVLHQRLMASLKEVHRLQRAMTQSKIEAYKRFPQLRVSAATKGEGGEQPRIHAKGAK